MDLASKLEDTHLQLYERQLKNSKTSDDKNETTKREQEKARSENESKTRKPSENEETNYNSESTRGSSVHCFRCNGKGHIGKECKATEPFKVCPIKLPKTTREDHAGPAKAVTTIAGATNNDKAQVIEKVRTSRWTTK